MSETSCSAKSARIARGEGDSVVAFRANRVKNARPSRCVLGLGLLINHRSTMTCQLHLTSGIGVGSAVSILRSCVPGANCSAYSYSRVCRPELEPDSVKRRREKQHL